MSDFDGPDCLRRLKREIDLEAANEEDDATELYPILTDGMRDAIREIGIRAPHVLYSLQGPTALTAASDRKTFSFGVDGAGNAIMPMGWVQISPRLSAFAGDYSYFWRDGVDFLDEGTRIRIPSDRSYSGTLYGRWVPNHPAVTASVAPILLPVEARELGIIKAAKRWAGEGNKRPDIVQAMDKKWAEQFPVWCLTFKRRFRGGGALLDSALWYLFVPDFGTT